MEQTSDDAMATTESGAVRLVVNQTTGTKHIPESEGDGITACGEMLVRAGAEENATWVDSNHLAQFPGDFGQLPADCEKCARRAEELL